MFCLPTFQYADMLTFVSSFVDLFWRLVAFRLLCCVFSLPPPPLLARWEARKTKLIKESIDGIPFVMSRDVRLTDGLGVASADEISFFAVHLLTMHLRHFAQPCTKSSNRATVCQAWLNGNVRATVCVCVRARAPVCVCQYMGGQKSNCLLAGY